MALVLWQGWPSPEEGVLPTERCFSPPKLHLGGEGKKKERSSEHHRTPNSSQQLFASL